MIDNIPAGPPGPTGPQGTDGFSCWDLNENRACDQEAEDKNGNGVCDIGDCQGPPGPPGEVNTEIIEDLQNQIDSLHAQIDEMNTLMAIRRFTDMGNGTIRDNKTGLIWLENAHCFETMNWDTAMITVSQLAEPQCGLLSKSTDGLMRLTPLSCK